MAIKSLEEKSKTKTFENDFIFFARKPERNEVKKSDSKNYLTIEDDLPRLGWWFIYGEQLGVSTLFLFNFTE